MTRKLTIRILRMAGILFLLLNIIAAFHAWRFTHFTMAGTHKENAGKMSTTEKIVAAFTGIKNPRPSDREKPDIPYQEIMLQSNKKIACWYIHTDSIHKKGTVILFHGYGGERSGMLGKAYILLDAGYDVLLPDFMGAGPSEGNTTTIGFREAEEVKTCYDYVAAAGKEKIILLGSSMGAVAVLKCIHDYPVHPSAIIIECPFGTMYGTVCARFRAIKFPVFPMAGILMFWGGVENGFNTFAHNPETYAKDVHCPALLVYGGHDERVSRQETDAIYNNLAGPKSLLILPLAGHNNYLEKYRQLWTNTVLAFANQH